MKFRQILTATLAAAVIVFAGPDHVRGQGFTFQFVAQDVFRITLGDAVWGDLDRNGRMDLVITGLAAFDEDTPVSTTFLNLGVVGSVDARGDSVWRQIYLPQGQGIRSAWLSDAALSDVNHDGALDFTISGASSLEPPYQPVTRMYQIVGTESVEIQTGIAGVLAGSLDWGDYDNDGDQDLLITGESSDGYLTRIFERSGPPGTPEFVDSGVRLTDVGLGDAQFGDYDADGDLDVLLTGDTGQGFVTILYRNDNGSFFEIQNAFTGLAFSSVDWGDFDNDGDLDILLAGGLLSPLIVEGHSSVYRNDGEDVFTNIGADLDGAFYGAAVWGDYDNDGLIDIMLSGGTVVRQLSLGRLYRNEGNGVFRRSINVAALLYSEAALGDYDYDGDLDLLQVGGGVTVQYRNDQLIVNDPPTAPDGLSATPAAGGAVLSWNPATDQETPSKGLTYNIRVGTSPDAIDVTAPMADVLTGRRLVSEMGNVHGSTTWTLRDLPAGSYYWSVQAIDNAYNPSAWAEEASFTVSESGGIAASSAESEHPEQFRIAGGYPNPFIGSTTIEFNLGRAQTVVAEVFTMLGGYVTTLEQGQVSAGSHSIRWDGRDALGSELGAGVYLLRFVSEDASRTLRLVRVRG